MVLPKLMLVPAESGYAVDPDADTLQAKLGGGPSRFRLDFIGVTSAVSVTWRLGLGEHAYLEAFFRQVRGSMPFLIDLVMDGAGLTEHEARVIPGSKRLTGVQGNLRVTSATLEVKPVASDTDYDATIVMLYEAYGNEGGAVLNQLAQLVNEDLSVLT